MGTTTRPKQPCELCGNLTSSKYTVCAKGSCAAEHRRRREQRRVTPEKRLLESAKCRAKKMGVKCDITLKDIYIPEFCPVLGIPLRQGNGKLHKFSPTLDRINPNGGYTKNNVQVMSYKANVMKNNASPEELLLFAKWINDTYKGTD